MFQTISFAKHLNSQTHWCSQWYAVWSKIKYPAVWILQLHSGSAFLRTLCNKFHVCTYHDCMQWRSRQYMRIFIKLGRNCTMLQSFLYVVNDIVCVCLWHFAKKKILLSRNRMHPFNRVDLCLICLSSGCLKFMFITIVLPTNPIYGKLRSLHHVVLTLKSYVNLNWFYIFNAFSLV